MQAAAKRAHLFRYSSPRYWPTWLFLLWLVVVARLPFRTNVRLHKLLGRMFCAVAGSKARTARRNLELCFPELSAAEIDVLLRRHFEAAAACIGETACAWFGSPARLRNLLEIEGVEHLEAALRGGRGVLLYTGHFTGLEVTGPLLSAVTDRFAFMYSRRRNALLDEVQRRRRERIAQRAFAKEKVRALLRTLAQNHVVWYAADQYYRGRHAEPVRFFHEPAMTNTAISRIASLSGAAVIPFFYRRRDDDSGYVLTFEPPVDGFPSKDAAADTRRLVERLEAAVRRCPEQYWWSHKRFRDRPAPLPDPYATPASAEPTPPAQAPSASAVAASTAAGPAAAAAAGATARRGHPVTAIFGVGKRLVMQVVRGVCIGTAHLVPGLSGASVADALGGEREPASTSEAAQPGVWRLIGAGRFGEACRRLDFFVLTPIAAGVIAAPIIFSQTVPLRVLLEELPEMTFGLVFGLIAASIVSLLGTVGERRLPSYGWLVAGVALGCGVSLSTSGSSPDSLWFLFVCGVVTAAAMLLPRVSGAFVLLVLGKYTDVIEAFYVGDLAVLLPLLAGGATGAVVVSRGMTWLLEHRRQATMMVIVGLLGGSLLAVWPFREWVYDDVEGVVRLVDAGLYVPQTLDRGVLLGSGTMLIGFVSYAWIERLVRRAGRRRAARLAGSQEG